MIEAVNSVLQNAPFVRGAAEQNSQVRTASNPDRVQEAAVAPYLSLQVHVDTGFDTAVLQIRDSNNGDVIDQIPSESKLEGRAREAERQADQTEQVRSRAVEQQAARAKAEAAQADLQQSAQVQQQQAAFAAAQQAGSLGHGTGSTLSVFA